MKSMLLAVAPNPTIDHLAHVPAMTVGAVHRATTVEQVAGGKGLNVARAACSLGCDTLTTGPLAGHAGRLVADMVSTEGLSADWYWLKTGETRTCLLLTHDRGDATVINEPGPLVSAAEWQGMTAYWRRLAHQAQAVAIGGSLPPGVEADGLRAAAAALATPARPVYLDTNGPALNAALAHPAGLCLKVNRAELSAGLETALPDVRHIVEAGQRLLARGAALVVVTLGDEGALAMAPAGCWQASVPPVEVVSTVGSGDSLLAGLAMARLNGESLETALAWGVACGAANALTNVPGQFAREKVEALLAGVRVKKLDSVDPNLGW